MPEPLHPALVHIPIALAMLMPLLSVLALLMIRWNLYPARTWGTIVLLQALLLGSGWIAASAGGREEDRVEKVVDHDLIEEHEHAAERFLVGAGVVLVISAAGLLSGTVGIAGRVATVVGSVALLGMSGAVGHSGGELVYKHGAASAYMEGTAQPELIEDGMLEESMDAPAEAEPVEDFSAPVGVEEEEPYEEDEH